VTTLVEKGRRKGKHDISFTIRCNYVCLSVLSVSLVFRVQTAKYIIKLLSQFDSSVTGVFSHQTFWRDSDCVIFNRGKGR